VIVVIGGAYCIYCDNGDRLELTLVTVILVIGGDYCSYCDSGDRGAYCSYCDSGDRESLL